jgi:hypothetical protein
VTPLGEGFEALLAGLPLFAEPTTEIVPFASPTLSLVHVFFDFGFPGALDDDDEGDGAGLPDATGAGFCACDEGCAASCQDTMRPDAIPTCMAKKKTEAAIADLQIITTPTR